MGKYHLMCATVLAALLAGCAGVPQAPAVVVVKPPENLVQPCPDAPSVTVSTNGELASYAAAVTTALRGCAARMEAIHEWWEATK